MIWRKINNFSSDTVYGSSVNTTMKTITTVIIICFLMIKNLRVMKLSFLNLGRLNNEVRDLLDEAYNE